MNVSILQYTPVFYWTLNATIHTLLMISILQYCAAPPQELRIYTAQDGQPKADQGGGGEGGEGDSSSEEEDGPVVSYSILGLSSTVFLRSDATATIFSLLVSLWLLFKGDVYFFGKPEDINNGWIRYVQLIQRRLLDAVSSLCSLSMDILAGLCFTVCTKTIRLLAGTCCHNYGKHTTHRHG